MWTKIATMILTDKNVQKVIIGTVVGALFVLIVIIYSILAAPWTMLTGWFSSIFGGGDITDNIDWNGYFAAQSHGAYIENYEQLRSEHIGVITGPYQEHWMATYDAAYATAAELKRQNATSQRHAEECGERFCRATGTVNAIVYSTFASGSRPVVSIGGRSYEIDSLDTSVEAAMDIGAIISSFNNVGLEWEWYKEFEKSNPGSISPLKLMDVPKDPATGEYIGELSSVDTVKLVNLIKKEAENFLVEHYPLTDGSCSRGASCGLGHTVKMIDVGSDPSKLPDSYADLVNSSQFQEPYFGVYYSTYCESHEHEETIDGITYTYTDHVWHTDYTVVGYVEYIGQQYVQNNILHLNDPNIPPDSMSHITEIYTNLFDLVGGIYAEMADHASKAIIIQAFHDEIEERLRDVEGNNPDQALNYLTINYPPGTIFPTDYGAEYISATFHDPTYPVHQYGVHTGVDFRMPINTEVRATSAGRVVQVAHNLTGYGKHIVTYQGKNAAGDEYYFIYAHLNTINIQQGAEFGPGTVLGLSGNTGWSTGPHLHYECQVRRANGTIESIDPFSAEVGLGVLTN